MRVDRRYRESDAYIVSADDDMKLTEVDGFYLLIEAMFARAWQDSIGNVGTHGSPSLSKRYEITVDGRLFFADGRAQHWCECVGADFEIVMARLRRG